MMLTECATSSRHPRRPIMRQELYSGGPRIRIITGRPSTARKMSSKSAYWNVHSASSDCCGDRANRATHHRNTLLRAKEHVLRAHQADALRAARPRA
ncbi:hypothetical protein PI125_g8376 [Phytophthora idaei]|nr:hypothetical protein PI125_g8376 [Phytophthora idaei]